MALVGLPGRRLAYRRFRSDLRPLIIGGGCVLPMTTPDRAPLSRPCRRSLKLPVSMLGRTALVDLGGLGRSDLGEQRFEPGLGEGAIRDLNYVFFPLLTALPAFLPRPIDIANSDRLCA
jgi:hypothetical protein